MPVHITAEELDKFNENGFTNDDVRAMVLNHRSEGLDDVAIRKKVDEQLSSFGSSINEVPKSNLNDTQAVQPIVNQPQQEPPPLYSFDQLDQMKQQDSVGLKDKIYNKFTQTPKNQIIRDLTTPEEGNLGSINPVIPRQDVYNPEAVGITNDGKLYGGTLYRRPKDTPIRDLGFKVGRSALKFISPNSWNWADKWFGTPEDRALIKNPPTQTADELRDVIYNQNFKQLPPEEQQKILNDFQTSSAYERAVTNQDYINWRNAAIADEAGLLAMALPLPGIAQASKLINSASKYKLYKALLAKNIPTEMAKLLTKTANLGAGTLATGVIGGTEIGTVDHLARTAMGRETNFKQSLEDSIKTFMLVDGIFRSAGLVGDVTGFTKALRKLPALTLDTAIEALQKGGHDRAVDYLERAGVNIADFLKINPKAFGTNVEKRADLQKSINETSATNEDIAQIVKDDFNENFGSLNDEELDAMKAMAEKNLGSDGRPLTNETYVDNVASRQSRGQQNTPGTGFVMGEGSELYGQPTRPQPTAKPSVNENVIPNINTPKRNLPAIQSDVKGFEFIPEENAKPIITPEQIKENVKKEASNPTKTKQERTGWQVPKYKSDYKPNYKVMDVKEAYAKEQNLPIKGNVTELKGGAVEGAEGSDSFYKKTKGEENIFRGVEGASKTKRSKLKQIDETEYNNEKQKILDEKKETLNNLYRGAKAVDNAIKKGVSGVGEYNKTSINRKITKANEFYDKRLQELEDKYHPKPEAHKYSFVKLPKSMRADKATALEYSQTNDAIAKAEMKYNNAKQAHALRPTKASKKRLNEARNKLKELKKDIKLDEGNYSDDIRRQAEKETQNIDTNESTLNHQEGLSLYDEDFGTPELSNETYNKDVEITSLINSFRNASTPEDKAKVVEDLIVSKEHNPNEINKVINKLLDEESKVGRKQYSPGDEGARQYAEDNARSENINDLINDITLASRKLKKPSIINNEAANKQLAKSNIELNSEVNPAGQKEYVTDKTRNLQKTYDEIAEKKASTTNETAKKAYGIQQYDVLAEKELESRRAVQELRDKPARAVAKDIIRAENPQERYNAYISDITKNIKYTKEEINDAIRKLNSISKKLKGRGIELNTYRDANDFIAKTGNKAMEELKAANEAGDLYTGKEIIDKYNDLLELNEKYQNGEKNWKYFSDSAVDEHYAQSNERVSDLLLRLKDPVTRKQALLEMENIKGENFKKLMEEKLSKLDPESSAAVKIRKQLNDGNITREDKKDFLNSLSPEELEVYARARARVLYKDYYKVLKRHRTNYAEPRTRVYDELSRVDKYSDRKEYKYTHSFDKEVRDDYDPEEAWKEFQNEVEPFLDFKTWRDRPDITKTTPEAVKANYGGGEKFDRNKVINDKNQFLKDNSKDIYTIKKILKNKEYFGRNEDGTKFTELQKLEKYYNKSNIKDIENYINKYGKSGIEQGKLKLLDRYNKYKKYLELEEAAEKAKAAYSEQMQEYKKVASFKNEQEKINRMSEDNPFEKDVAQYRDTNTGAVDYKQVKRDLELMNNDEYLEAKAKEAVKTGYKHSDKYYITNKNEYEQRRELLKINYGDKLDDINHNEVVRSYTFGKYANSTETNAGRYTQGMIDSINKDAEAKAFMQAHPDIKVEIAERGTHGADAEIIFIPEGEHIIRLNKTASDKQGELNLLKEEFGHVEQFEKLRQGDEEAIKTHREAFAKADEAYAEYDKNRNFIDNVIKNKVLDKYLNEQEIEKLNNWKNKVKIQKATKAEQEAHNGKRDNQSTSRDSENISEGESRGTDGNTRVSEGTSGSDGNSNAGLRQTLEEFRGKSLNKYAKSISEWAKDLGNKTMDKLVTGAKKLRQQEDMMNFSAEQMGFDPEQIINRELKTGESYVSPKWTSKGRDSINATKETGLSGKKVRDREKNLTTREKILSNMLELHKRLDVVRLGRKMEEYYGKPISQMAKGDIAVNKTIFNMCVYKGWSHDTYKAIMEGEQSIRKMFKNKEAADQIVNVYKSHPNVDYVVPDKIFKQTLPGFGEDLATVSSRYGKSSKKALAKRGGLFLDAFMGNAKTNMLATPQWALGNVMGSSVMTASHMGMRDFLRASAKAFFTKEKELPIKLFDNNLFEKTKIKNVVRTGEPVTDAIMHLVSGHYIPVKGFRAIGKTLGVTANIINTPYVGVRKFLNGILSLGGKTEDFIRKINAIHRIEENRKPIILNMAQRMEKQKITTKMLAEELANNPKNAKIRDAIVKDVEDVCGEYRILSPFERNVVRRLVPFHTWIRAITRNVSKLAQEQPSAFAMTVMEIQRLKDLNYDKKDYQKFSMPIRNPITGEPVYDSLTGEQLYFNANNYLNLFNTHEELSNPMMNTAPYVSGAGSVITGKNSFGNKLTSPRYAMDSQWAGRDDDGNNRFEKRLYDKKTKTWVKDKEGNYTTKLPLKERVKAYPINLLRMGVIGGSNKLVNYEKAIGAFDNYSSSNKVDKARAGKFSPYDKLYDTTFLGYNNGDYEYIQKKLKQHDKQKYYVEGDKKYRFGNNLSTGTKVAKYALGGLITTKHDLNKNEKAAAEIIKKVPETKVFGYIPTKKTFDLYSQANKLKRAEEIREKELEKVRKQKAKHKNKKAS